MNYRKNCRRYGKWPAILRPKRSPPLPTNGMKNIIFPIRKSIKPMGELGFFGTVIPEEYGGNNMGWLAAMILTEEIARASSSLRVQINMQALGCAFTIFRYGTRGPQEEIYRQTGQRRISGRFRHHRTQRRFGCHGHEIHGRGQRGSLADQRLQDLDLQRQQSPTCSSTTPTPIDAAGSRGLSAFVDRAEKLQRHLHHGSGQDGFPFLTDR